MSLINEKESEIQYILNDSEFMFNPSDLKVEEMNDIIYTDGNQAFVVNGHFFQGEGDTPTLVLQEGDDISQYLINDDKGELLIANIQNNTSVDPTQEAQQIIQYVDEDGNITDPPEIVYINEDGNSSTQENCTQYQLAELIETDAMPDDDEEVTRIIDLDSLVQQQNGDDVLELNAAEWYHYAVVKDNNLHHYAIPSLELNKSATVTSNTDISIDVSTITGKNLLTGQVVTLESYMDKIQKKISKNSLPWKRPKHNLNAFLNKKFNLGLTVGGRQLVGKIVYVGNKEVESMDQQESEIVIQENMDEKEADDDDDNNEVTASDMPDVTSETENHSKTDKMQVQTKLLSKKSDQFQRISKTLSDLMSMENVNKQLYQKNIKIKIIDKYCNTAKKINRHVSFISGYMEQKIVANEKNELEEEWIFEPDILKPEFVRTKTEKKSQRKYPKSVGLTIVTTYQKNQSVVQVIFDDSKKLECDYCDKIFKNEQLLFWHLNDVHKQCEFCKCVFGSFEELMQHKKLHHHLNELKTCPINNCKKYFKTEALLKKHLAVHKLEAFKCPACPYSGMSESDLRVHSQTHPNSCDTCGEIFISESKLNIHKRTHSRSEVSIFKKIQSTKFYSCDICKRTFSRQSNLQRHVDIHKGAEQLYRCAICECSYHYISSLTRHIVQNHVQIQRQNFVPSIDAHLVI